jgi:hypothetical protein
MLAFRPKGKGRFRAAAAPYRRPACALCAGQRTDPANLCIRATVAEGKNSRRPKNAGSCKLMVF